MKYQQLYIKKRREFDQTIYNLKKLGLTYVEIAKEIENKGITIQCTTVREICIKMYASKNEELKKGCHMFEELYILTNGDINYLHILLKLQEKSITLSNDIIKKIYTYTLVYDMKQQHWSCTCILEHLNKLGIYISYGEIRRMCNEIYQLNPKLKNKYIQNGEFGISVDKQIFELRERGLSFKKIAETLATQNIHITRQRVEQRYKRYLEGAFASAKKAI